VAWLAVERRARLFACASLVETLAEFDAPPKWEPGRAIRAE